MRKIAHVVNPVIVGEESDLFIAQPVTFETMRVAREFAQGRVEVELYSAQYLEDQPLVPEFFHMTPDLERSVLDLGEFQEKRKLPLIKDILDRLYEVTEAEYLIYTNVDIALLPHFYVAVDKLVESGYDAFVVNRRTISKKYHRLADIPSMYAQAGERHKGYDCFVFQRSRYPHYHLGTTCIGTSRVGAVLIVNLIYNATRFHEFRDLHLTFHIGNDKVWKSTRYADYNSHNDHELKQILAHYRALEDPRDDAIIRRLVARYSPPSRRQKVRDRLVRAEKRVRQWIAHKVWVGP